LGIKNIVTWGFGGHGG